jgi:hypothetical protein
MRPSERRVSIAASGCFDRHVKYTVDDVGVVASAADHYVTA